MALTDDQWTDLRYVGGGYFRVKVPAGEPSPTIHGPELLRELLRLRELTRCDCCGGEATSTPYCASCHPASDL